MTRIRLGGIKILEGRSHLISSRKGREDALGTICARLAAGRINLGFLTHVADHGKGDSVTTLSTESSDAFSSYFLLKLDQSIGATVRLQSDIVILSVFPHDQRPHVTGELLAFLAHDGVRPQGIASSPSAMTILISAMDMEKVIDGLFQVFDFSAYQSPLDWHAAYRGKEQVFKEIVCSYQEQVIKVYHIAHLADLDLWDVALPFPSLAGLGEALKAMDERGVKLPFFVGQSGPEMSLLMTLCFPADRRSAVREVFDHHLPGVARMRGEPVAMVYLHGPHFGDRYGITNALARALHDASVPLPAISCAVSSISFVVSARDLERTLEALGTSFQVPDSES